MDAETRRAIVYSQKLLDLAVAVVGASRVELNESWARNPKVVALSILCRSISNFRAAVLLVQQGHVLEARSILRMLIENLLWIGALRERGSAFVQDMIADDSHNKKALAELTLKMTGKHGGDMNTQDARILRDLIKGSDNQTIKKLHANRTAADGVVEIAYVEYTALSLDAVHCSVVALGRHLSSERTEAQSELTVSVVPRTTDDETLRTVLRACSTLLGIVVAANEVVGSTSESGRLEPLLAEFEQNGWPLRH